MFTRRRQQQPPAAEFAHAAECATPNALPEWEQLDRYTWRRTCSCRVSHWTAPSSRPEPPDPSVLRHGCSYVPAAKWDPDGFWRVTCQECGVSTVVVPRQRGEPVPVNGAPVRVAS